MPQLVTHSNCQLEEVVLSGLLGDLVYSFLLRGNGGLGKKIRCLPQPALGHLSVFLGRGGSENRRKRLLL